MTMKRNERFYMGDGVYARVDERGIVLTTEYGDDYATNTIVLDTDALVTFERFIAALRAETKRAGGRLALED